MDVGFLFVWILQTFVCHAASASILDWIWTNKKEVQAPMLVDGTPMFPVPYEVKSDDEKFLEEASKFTELMKVSALDTCQHKVILQIQTSCSSMTEEEIAKLSVNLLNCQSQVDGRQLFPCTDNMSLKECTSAMDANMWNAYHLMSNRARAVCLASRRIQFQALSEMTVNKLMSSSQEQIKQMKTLQDGQERLESIAVDTITTLDQGHQTLMNQQEKLRISNQGMQDFVAHNLRELSREKALIAAGHRELSKMTEDIRDKLDLASQELIIQSHQRTDDHQQLMEDVRAVRLQALNIIKHVDESSKAILVKHSEALSHYESTLHNLKKINETVNYLLQVVNMTRLELDLKLEWIQHYIGGTGDQLEKVYLIVLHIGYLFLGMLCASFLNLPTFTRAALVLVVPLNLFTYHTHGAESALDFPSLSVLLTITTIANILLNWVSSWVYPSRPTLYLKDVTVTSQNTTNSLPVNNTVGNQPGVTLTQKLNRCTTSISRAVSNLVYGGGTSSTVAQADTTFEEEDEDYSPLQRHDVSSSRVYNSYNEQTDSTEVVSDWLKSRTSRRETTPSSNRSSSSKITCSARCKNGRSCRISVYPGRDRCYKHLTESPM